MRGLPQRRRGSRPSALPNASGELLRRKMARHSLRAPRPRADLWSPPPRVRASWFVEHLEEARLHRGLGQRTPQQQAPIRASETGPVLRRDRLGRVLHENSREDPLHAFLAAAALATSAIPG